MTPSPNRSTPVLPVYIALGILVLASLAFIALFITASSIPEGGAEVVAEVDSDSYMDAVNPLLEDADPARGEELISTTGCHACHVAGAANRLAPPFSGVAARAVERRPPMSAEAYIYESIVHPDAHIVGGYTAQMPVIYGTILSDQDIGDIMAYLLTQRTTDAETQTESGS